MRLRGVSELDFGNVETFAADLEGGFFGGLNDRSVQSV